MTSIHHDKETALDTPAKVLAAALPSREIIGGSGCPISAHKLIDKDPPVTPMRWRKRTDATFSLECLCADGIWREVPLWYQSY